jgi:hypothetical protein
MIVQAKQAALGNIQCATPHMLSNCMDPGQVKNSSGQWIDAEPIEGAFVCNIGAHFIQVFDHWLPFNTKCRQHLVLGLPAGDMLRVMSAGMYQPTPHRVINTSSSKTRTSVAFFYEPVRLLDPLYIVLCSQIRDIASWCMTRALNEFCSQNGELPAYLVHVSSNVTWLRRHSRQWCSQQRLLPCTPGVSLAHGVCIKQHCC